MTPRAFRISNVGFRASRKAFTLIEVLVSLAIITVLLPPIMYGISLASSGAALARNRTQATLYAQQKLDELLVTGPIDNGSGDFADQSPHFTWSAAVETFDSPTIDNLTTGMDQLTVTVTWQQQGQPRTVALTTLVYRPAGTTGTSAVGGLTP